LAIIANGVGSAAGQSKREGSGTRPIPLAFFAGFWMLFPCRQEEFKKSVAALSKSDQREPKILKRVLQSPS
jgi:hypothetical protein